MEIETRPDKKKYRHLASATIIGVFAAIILVIGVLCFIGVITDTSMLFGMSAAILGVVCILTSAFLMLFVSIAEDLHWQSYLKEYYGEETVNYHKASLKKLQSIEFLLSQQDPQHMQASYQPMPGQPYPQPVSKNSNADPTTNRMRYTVSDSGNRFHNDADELPYDYSAQYRRPDQRKKTVNAPKSKES